MKKAESLRASTVLPFLQQCTKVKISSVLISISTKNQKDLEDYYFDLKNSEKNKIES